MKMILYELREALDTLVDSGNMMLIQAALLFCGCLFFASAIMLDGVRNELIHGFHIRELLLAIAFNFEFFAGLLWIYHKVVRGDSFY